MIQDLELLGNALMKNYEQNFVAADRRLSIAFKEQFTKCNNDNLIYNDYTVKVDSGSTLCIYFPNQWIYTAAFFVDYYKMLKAYRDKVLQYIDKENIKNCQNNPDLASELLNKANYNEEDRNLIVRFLSDYKWWRGGKTIDRNDYFFSPILSLAKLVNASQGYVADICKNLSENPVALNVLLNEIKSDYYKNGDNVNTIIYSPLEDREYSVEELAKEYKDVMEKGAADKTQVARRLLFGVKYGRLLAKQGIKSREVLDAAGYSDLQTTDFDDGRSLAKLIEADTDGVSFWDTHDIKTEELQNLAEGETPDSKIPLAVIYYGSPGCGKSYTVKNLLKGKSTHRTTFHPDTDYSSFVGTYKPVVNRVLIDGKEEEKISYKFIPQVFTDTYVEAWNEWLKAKEEGTAPKHVYLIIEEINRGNCAQVFGDLFQLLDRDYDDFSEYPIKAERDLCTYLQEDCGWDEDHEGVKNGNICLPPNMHFVATMNTSDQSLFPMDSAFKRRWGWEYMPIKTKSEEAAPKIRLGSLWYDWGEFLRAVNGRIDKATHSEDKQLGYWFVNPKDKQISVSTFVSKVIFYLWNDVFKDMGANASNPFAFLHEGKYIVSTFNKFFDSETSEIDLGTINTFMYNLGVYPYSDEIPIDESEAPLYSETEGSTDESKE